MEINVGDYVRTKQYGIKKICKISIEHYYFGESFPKGVNGCVLIKNANEHITKHSKDIIDLIEVGDYVNGLKVYDVYSPDGKEVYWIKLYGNPAPFKNDEIKSILTYEQFEANVYKIEKEV